MKTNCDIGYVNTLLTKAKEAEHHSTEKALILSKEALNIAKMCHYKNQEGRAYVRMGRCYWINGVFDDAIDCLNQGLMVAEQVNDKVTYTEALNGRGNVFITMELFDQASADYLKALRYASEFQLSEQESKLLNNLGTLHEELKDYQQALKYFKYSLDLAQKLDDNYGVAIAYLNMGNVYLGLDDLTQAQTCVDLALAYAIETDKTLFLAHIYESLGKLSFQEKAYESAIGFYDTAIEKAKESQDLNILVRIYIDLALAYDKHKDFIAADDCFQKAFQLSETIGVVEFMPKIHEHMALFYEKNDRFDQAQKHYKAYYNLSKKIEDNRRKERIKSIEIQSKLKESQAETESYRRLSEKLENSYQQMRVVSKIGQTMTATHKLSEIFDQLYKQVNQLMDAQSLGVALYDQDNQKLVFELLIENGQAQETLALSIDNKKSWLVWSFLNKKTLRINDAEAEYKKYLEDVSNSRGELMLSAMYAPLMIEGQPLGVLTIQSKEKNQYHEQDEVLLETLASYLAIAIKNAIKSKELAVLNAKLKTLSELDGLTGIPNRRLFDEKFEELWQLMMAEKNPLSLIMLDIDFFKNFNDQYGHLVGDEVVIKVAHHLQTMKRHSLDFVGRYGGDEFVMILPNCGSKEANTYAKSLKESIIKLNQEFHVEDLVTLSIGVSTTHPSKKKSKEVFLDKADHELYMSKENGKNRISSSTY